MSAPKVSVVVPTYDREEKLRRLLASIPAASGSVSTETIVVNGNPEEGLDVGSFDDSVSVVQTAEETYIAGARNVGWNRASGRFVFFVDDDNVLAEGCISALASALESNEDLTLVAPLMLYYEDPERVWCAGGLLDGPLTQPSHYFEGESKEAVTEPLVNDVDYFPNAYMVRSRVDVRHDERLFPHNWTEIDFCHRVKSRGGTLATVTAGEILHDIPYTSKITRINPWKIRDQARSRILFRRKHGTRLDWLLFWGVVFPISTAYYGYRMMVEEDPATTLLRDYLGGTVEGARVPVRRENR